MKRKFAPQFVCLLLALAVHPVNADRPNFVIILADDLGYGDLGCHGNMTNRTPHLDRLAREGLRFLDFHANAANCSPTRAALLTGRYQQRMGIEAALGENARGLPRHEITMAERLREAGYATGMFGKWHLGYSPENGPNQHGFDTFVGHLHGATDYISHVDKYGRRDWWHNNQPVDEAGYNTMLITRHSLEFIEDHKDEPFFLFVSHSAIHFPWMLPGDPPHREAGKRYEDGKGKLGPHLGQPIQPVVQRMVEELDRSVGQILQALERLKLDRKTLLFFTSDNGGIVRMKGVSLKDRISTNAPLRGQKHGLYEGGHRVPAIAWMPGRIAPGESSASVMTMDLHPTLLKLAGLKPPSNDDPNALDGTSLAAHMFEGTAIPERALFWRQGDSKAVRWGDWKLVRIHQRPWELYHLGRDLAERNDLSRTQPEIQQRLQNALEEWERDLR